MTYVASLALRWIFIYFSQERST